jgi:hypothetical protein
MRPIIGITPEIAENGNISLRYAYTHAIELAGGIPLLLPCTEDEALLEELAAVCHGFVFSGGNLGFSKIVLENADAIVFNGFNFLRRVAISVSGGTLTLFSGCAFHATPTLSVENNNSVHFDSCYMQDGTPYKPL